MVDLPAPLRPIRPTFFARADGQVEILQQRFARFVGKIHFVEFDFAAYHFQRRRVRFVQDGLRFGQGGHAVADGTDVFKQPCRFPHDVLRQAVHAQRHGRGVHAPTPTCP